MTIYPSAKKHLHQRDGDRLLVYREATLAVQIADPDHHMADLLELADGTRTIDQLIDTAAHKFGKPLDQIREDLKTLDEARLLDDTRSTHAAATSVDSEGETRYGSNLAFFGAFSSLAVSAADYQQRLARSSVLLLGAGGIGTSTLLTLTGLGVGTVTVVDFDHVEERNLARQFLYTENDIGSLKADVAVRATAARNSNMKLVAQHVRLSDPDDIARLLTGVDLVLALVDQPREVRLWVDEACVTARVPYIVAGVQGTHAIYYSVDPRRSGCLNCMILSNDGQMPELPSELVDDTNPTVGPVANILGGLVGLEATRYLTKFAAPISAGRMWRTSLATGVATQQEWKRNPHCRCAES